MTLKVVRKIFNANVFFGDKLDYVALRNKAISTIMIVNHWGNARKYETQR